MKSATLLKIFAQHEPHKIINILWNEDFAINDITDEGDSIFHVLIHSRSKKICDHLKKLLINFDINSVDINGNNCLQRAIIDYRCLTQEFLIILIENGLNLSHKNHAGKTAFELLAERKINPVEVIKKLENKELIINLFECSPSLVSEDESRKPLIHALFKNSFIQKQDLSTLLHLFAQQKDDNASLKKYLAECFNHFHENSVVGDLIDSLNDNYIDVEYYLALGAINTISPVKILNPFKKSQPNSS